MIEARKAIWFEKIFLLYTRNLLWRRFDGVRVAGLENLRDRDKTLPLLAYSNHSSWFDPLIVFIISQNIGLDVFAMMEERNLAKLKFFRKIGAFSVVRENPREAVKSIRYAADLLNEKPNRAVWIFPQGEIQPNDARPLKLFRGAARIVERVDNCSAIPAAMRFEFLDGFKPSAFVEIGAPEQLSGNPAQITEVLQTRLTATLDGLKRKIVDGETDLFEKI